MALALRADQFERQQAGDGLRRRDHFRTRQPSRSDDTGQIDAIQQRHKQKQSSQGSPEDTGGQIQAAHVGDLSDLRLHRGWTFLVSPSGQARKAFFPKQNDQGVDADGVAGSGQFPLHVVHRKIAFAHGHSQIPDSVAEGSILRAALRLAEEGSALFGVVAELVTEDTKSARGIAETAGDLGGGLLVDEESAQGLVLALQGKLGGEEELLVGWCR